MKRKILNNKKYFIIIFSFVLVLTIFTISLYSYSYFKITKTGDKNIIAVNGCLNMTFIDGGNNIVMHEITPVSDIFGLGGEYYSFSITNHCDEWSNYSVNLETIPQTTREELAATNLKIDLETDNNSVSRKRLSSSDLVETTINEASEAYNLLNSSIRPNTTEIYKFRVWMDKDVTDYEGVAGTYYNGKISVSATISPNPNNTDGVIMSAPLRFNDITNKYETYSNIWDYKNIIEYIEFISDEYQITNYDEIFDISLAQDNSINAYLVNKKLYIQHLNGVKLNPDSSYLFANFEKLKGISGLKYVLTEDVTNMAHMFENCKEISTISLNYFNTSNVTDMSYMFAYTGYNKFNYAIDFENNFDTSNVTSMSHMFDSMGYNSNLLRINLSNFDTSNVTDMSYMFKSLGYNDNGLTLDISNFNTSSVINMSYMFNEVGCYDTNFTFILGDSFDTSSVTDMSHMFDDFARSASEMHLNLGNNFDTSNVTNMEGMFSAAGVYCPNFSLNLGDKFDTGNVINMSYMFNVIGREDLTFELNLGDKFDTSNVTNMAHMFEMVYQLRTNEIIFDLGDKFDTSNVTDMSQLFLEFGFKSNSVSINLGNNFDTSNVTNMSGMFNRVGFSATTVNINYGDKFDTSNVTNMGSMYYQFAYTVTNNPDILNIVSNFDTSNVTDMSFMFYATCYNNTTLTLDVSNFDTSNVTNMKGMFDDTGRSSTAFNLDVSNWNTSNVTNMNDMFYGYGASNPSSTLTLDLTNWNTSNVTDMGYMFYGIGGNNSYFTLDLSNFDTSNVTNMENMFREVKINVDISNFNFYNVTNLYSFAYNATKLTGTIFIDFRYINNSSNAFGITSSLSNYTRVYINYTNETLSSLESHLSNYSRYFAQKGSLLPQIPYNSHNISKPNDINISKMYGIAGSKITLSIDEEEKIILSFKVNGTIVKGDYFIMPDEDVEITEVVLSNEYTIVETEHNPYQNNYHTQTMYENTFEGASSIVIKLAYQTYEAYENTSDFITIENFNGIIRDSKGTPQFSGNTLTKTTIKSDGNYIKISFTSQKEIRNYYGFKAIIIPVYD